MYIHVPKEKRAKLEPSGKKGVFVGYSDYSKAYRVYISGQRHIEVNRDVIFHEEAVFHKVLELSTEDEVSALEFPNSEIQREEEKFEDQIPYVSANNENASKELLKVPPYKRRSTWYQEMVQEGEKHKAPLRISKERLQKYSGLMGQLDITEPPSCKEATSQ